MKNIIQETSFKLCELVDQMMDNESLRQSLEKFGTPLKKEYLKLLFSAYRATNLNNYNDDENIIKVLEVNAHIKLFLNELERLEVKIYTSEYLKLISKSSKK